VTYYDLLRALHRFLQPATYLEVGVRSGRSLALALPGTRAIGIDPELAIPAGFAAPGPTQFFHQSSDEFFAAHSATERLGNLPIDLAFIDGMHLFEFALRDFINIERHCTRDSTVLVHDCYPVDAASAARERSTECWSGDVWKLIVCLRRHRPDLDVQVVKVEPTGLAIVRGLDPGSTLLSERYEALLQEYRDLPYTALESDKDGALNAIENEWGPIVEVLTRRVRQPAAAGAPQGFVPRAPRKEPRMLCVLLCYNDGDILPDVFEHYLRNRHVFVVWNHGSDDDTQQVIERYREHLVEYRYVPREFDFYELYPEMSRHLIARYREAFDWISWPDQDEILEGPTRAHSYYEYCREVYQRGFDSIQFNNYNYWFTAADDASIASPVERVRHYCLYPNCSPRMRSWRAAVTNLRRFNHNELPGFRVNWRFNLRHYPMRSAAQMARRLERDRAGLRRGQSNLHYEIMKAHPERLMLLPEQLHYDSGGELNPEVVLDWDQIYKVL
jgi:hypothetical protein